MICINLLRLFVLTWILCVIDCQNQSFDFGFYYNSYTQEILFYNYQDNLNAELEITSKGTSLSTFYLDEFINAFHQNELLYKDNLIDSYVSKAELGEFVVSNYSLVLDEIQIYLILIDYNVSSFQYNEVIIEVPSMGKLAIYPQKIESLYEFKKCTQCSKDEIEKTKKEISNTFVFQLIDDFLDEREIEKLYLIGKQNNKLTYYTDLSSVFQIQSKNRTVTSIAFYLEKLPEVFDLYITYHSSNINDFKGDKILIIIKDIVYPHFEVNQNPNYTMLFICISIIMTGFLLASIALLLNSFILKLH